MSVRVRIAAFESSQGSAQKAVASARTASLHSVRLRIRQPTGRRTRRSASSSLLGFCILRLVVLNLLTSWGKKSWYVAQPKNKLMGLISNIFSLCGIPMLVGTGLAQELVTPSVSAIYSTPYGRARSCHSFQTPTRAHGRKIWLPRSLDDLRAQHNVKIVTAAGLAIRH